MAKRKQRDVLFLCQYFYPEHNSSATLPFDTACALAAAGYTVDALCGMPHEYTDAQDVPARETVRGVTIRRLRYLHPGRTRRAGRLLNFFSFTLRVLLHLGELRRHRAVIVYSNPPILPLCAWLAERLFGTKLIFVAYDIYPEIALAADSIRPGGLVDRVMQAINRRVFRRAAAVAALSEEMRDTLLRLRPELDDARVHVLPNWAHESAPRETAPEDGVLTVGYFGNLGLMQETETLLAAIERLRGDRRIRFLIAGHGSKLADFRARTADDPQVRIFDFLTGEALERALTLCDCCVVTLVPDVKGLCMPSKYYSYLQAGKAVLSVMEPDACLAREVVSERIGAAVPPGDDAALCAALTAMAAAPEAVRAAGERARAIYAARYDRSLGTERYVALVRSVLGEA